MSTTKRFYWLKLKENFFEDDTISWIEEQKNGKDYILFYLKLCLKSLKTEGFLVRYVGNSLIPYDYEKLAKLTNTNIDIVRMAMVLFEEIELIKRLDTGEIYFMQIPEMTGSETDKAELMRKKRAKEKLQGNNVTPALPECYHISDKDIDEDEDIDIKKECERDKKKKSKSPKPDYEAFVGVYNATHTLKEKTPTPKMKRDINKFSKRYSLDDFKEVCTISQQSDFLSGKNSNNWVASFDWLINPENARKVLVGQYGGLENKNKENMYDTMLEELEGEIEDEC